MVSLDGWAEVMWDTQDGVGEAVWAYFILLIVVGNVFLLPVGA